jgi:O-antigen/teichoic acid export membrane protein
MKNILFSLPMLVRNGLTFILFYHFADALTPTVFGALNLSFAYIVFLNSLLVFSLGSGFTRYYYERPDSKYRLGFFLISLGVISTNTLVVFLLRDKIFIDKLSNYSSVIIAISAMSGLSELFLIKIRLANELKSFSILNISIVLILIILIFLFGQDGLTLNEILLSYALQFSAVFLIFLCYVFRNATPEIFSYIRENRAQYRKPVIFSLCVLPGNFGYLLNDAVDKFVISDCLSLGEVATYSFTYQLGFILLFVFSVLVKTGLMPFVFQHYKKSTTILTINRAIKYFTVSYAIFFLVTMWLKGFAYSFFNESYAEAAPFLPMVLAAVFYAILSTVFVININLAEKAYLGPLVELSSGLVNLVLSLVLISEHGIVGGFVSTYFSLLFRMVAYLVIGAIVYRKYKYNLLYITLASLGMAFISMGSVIQAYS